MDAYVKIVSNVNEAKNNIIVHLFDKLKQPIIQKTTQISPSAINLTPDTDSYSNRIKKNISHSKLIIPVSTTTPKSDAVSQTEQRLLNIINDCKSEATVVKTNAKNKGNIVFTCRAAFPHLCFLDRLFSILAQFLVYF